jgi:teichoic acid transport system permease protein
MIPLMGQRAAAKGHPWVEKVLEINPGSIYVELVRGAMLESYRADLAKIDYSQGHLWLYGLAWAVVAFCGGFWYFYRAEERYGRG